MGIGVKVFVVCEDEDKIGSQLLSILNGIPRVENVLLKDLSKELERSSPDLIFLSHSEENTSIELIQLIHHYDPLTGIIFISQEQDFGLLRNVSRAGATDFYVLPEEAALLTGKIPTIMNMVEERKRQELETAATTNTFKRGRGQIYTFYSAKGGSGKTLLSAAFAQTLKFESTAQVLLIDLNLQYGGSESILSIESNRSLVDLMPVIDELNENHLTNVAEKEPFSKLDVLLSPMDAEVAESVADDFVQKLLRTCRRSYDFVIVDLPAYMNSHTYIALEEADKIFYVLNLDTPSIKSLKKFEELAFRLGISLESQLEIICNQVGRDNEIGTKDISKLVQQPVVAQIRRDFKGVQASINKGEPIRKEASAKKLIPFSKDIRKWVLSIIK